MRMIDLGEQERIIN